jgi:hypothetical protein
MGQESANLNPVQAATQKPALQIQVDSQDGKSIPQHVEASPNNTKSSTILVNQAAPIPCPS